VGAGSARTVITNSSGTTLRTTGGAGTVTTAENPRTTGSATIGGAGTVTNSGNPSTIVGTDSIRNAMTNGNTISMTMGFTSSDVSTVTTRSTGNIMSTSSGRRVTTLRTSRAVEALGSARTLMSSVNSGAVGTAKIPGVKKTVEAPSAAQTSGAFCIDCSEMPCDTYFKPCLHIAVCSLCAPGVTACFICNEDVESVAQIEECYNCLEKKSNVLLKPCNHISVCIECALRITKCAQCHVPIEQAVYFADLCGLIYLRQVDNANKLENDNDVTNYEVDQLKKELEAIKEQMLCSICMDSNQDVAFQCGHRTCKKCGERLIECHICRVRIESRILLF